MTNDDILVKTILMFICFLINGLGMFCIIAGFQMTLWLIRS